MSDPQKPASGPLAPVFREPASPEAATASPESPFQGATTPPAVSREPASPPGPEPTPTGPPAPPDPVPTVPATHSAPPPRDPLAAATPSSTQPDPAATTPSAPQPDPAATTPFAPSPGRAPVPLVIVDGANVVGSVPDGWWRDRAGAAIRLRDSLAKVPATGLAGLPAPVEVILVVEGRAREIPQAPAGVRVERAAGSGDDKIIDLVRREQGTRPIVVVTADRGLRARATALGAEIRGPSAVPRG